MKNNGVTVDGDVGQVVAGNVVHEGANANSHMSNVITIHSGEPRAPVSTITELQRKRIAAKVKEVMKVAGIKQQLDVYSVVLTDFGVEKILNLPRDQFKDVMAMLDNWIVEERGTSATAEESDTPAVNAGEQTHCAGCAAVSHRLDRMRTGLRLVSLGLVGALSATGYVVYANTLDTAGASSVPLACQLDGKVYSVGGVTRMPDGGVYECSASSGDATVVQWIPARNLGSGGKRR